MYSGFSHQKWWFSIAMLVYQRVAAGSYRPSVCWCSRDGRVVSRPLPEDASFTGHGEFGDLPGGNPELFTDAHPQQICQLPLSKNWPQIHMFYMGQKPGNEPKNRWFLFMFIPFQLIIMGFWSTPICFSAVSSLWPLWDIPSHWTRLRSVLPLGGCSASKGAAAGSFTARGHAVAEPHGVLPEVWGEISTLRTCWVWANNDMHMHVCEHVYTDRYNAQIIYIYHYI